MRAQKPRVWSLLSSQVSGTPALEVGLSQGCSGVWGAGTETQNSREIEIWGRQTGGGHPLRAGLSPPLRVRLPGTGAEKSGVCPALEVDLNCAQECLSGGEGVADLKCCRAGCATVCQMPSGNPGGLHQAGRETVLVGGRSIWFGEVGCSQLWDIWLGGRRRKQFS